MTTFALPDLRGRTPVNFPNQEGIRRGVSGGSEEVTLSANEMPTHRHTLNANTTEGTNNTPVRPSGAQLPPQMFSTVSNNAPYYTDANAQDLVALHPETVSKTGGNLPHSNQQPSIVLRFTMALTGYFPPRS